MPDHAIALALLAIASLVTLAAPHRLPLHRVSPRSATAVWMLALVLRALLAVGFAAVAYFYVPHYSSAAPALWIAASTTVFASVLLLVFVRLRRTLRERSLGEGPEGSVVIADRDVYVALTGVGRAEVLVSAAALDRLDDAELGASIAHEHGHRALAHRSLSLAGSALHALARPLPAGSACRRGLRLGLERQADEYAVERTSDPLALASAICKVAPSPSPTGAMGAGTSPTNVRVLQLMEGGRTRGSSLLERSATALAAALFSLTALTAIALGATLTSYS